MLHQDCLNVWRPEMAEATMARRLGAASFVVDGWSMAEIRDGESGKGRPSPTLPPGEVAMVRVRSAMRSR